jgi:hypothetical protein
MSRSMFAAAAVGLSFAVFAVGASAQATMKSVAGTYSPVTVPAFGEKPRGLLILSPNGYYSLIVGRAQIPPVASGARTKATDVENKAMVDGSIAHYGKWSIDDGGKAITFHVEMSSFPNWDRKPQKRALKSSGDTLVYVVAAPSTGSGAPSELTWRRVK